LPSEPRRFSVIAAGRAMDVQSGSVFYLGLVLTCTGLDVPDFEKSSMYQNQIDFSIYKKQQRF
jgi:hypothetical protein